MFNTSKMFNQMVIKFKSFSCQDQKEKKTLGVTKRICKKPESPKSQKIQRNNKEAKPTNPNQEISAFNKNNTQQNQQQQTNLQQNNSQQNQQNKFSAKNLIKTYRGKRQS